jgi:hypothetical protein
MAIAVQWEDSKHRVLHFNFMGLWNWVDFDNATRSAWDMLNAVDHKVVVFLDFTADCVSPAQSRIPILRTLMHPHPNQDRVVLIGKTPDLAFIEAMMKRIYPHQADHYRSVNNLITAYQLAEASSARS